MLALYCLNVVPFHFALSNSVTLYLEVTDRILSIMVHLLCYNGHNAHTRTYGQWEWVKKSVLYVRFKAPRSPVPRQGRVHTHARTHAIWYVNHWLTLNLVGPVYLSINYWRVYMVLNLPICSLPPTHRINVLSTEHKELGPSPRKEASAAVLRGLTGRPRPGLRSPSPRGPSCRLAGVSRPSPRRGATQCSPGTNGWNDVVPVRLDTQRETSAGPTSNRPFRLFCLIFLNVKGWNLPEAGWFLKFIEPGSP